MASTTPQSGDRVLLQPLWVEVGAPRARRALREGRAPSHQGCQAPGGHLSIISPAFCQPSPPCPCSNKEHPVLGEGAAAQAAGSSGCREPWECQKPPRAPPGDQQAFLWCFRS